MFSFTRTTLFAALFCTAHTINGHSVRDIEDSSKSINGFNSESRVSKGNLSSEGWRYGTLFENYEFEKCLGWDYQSNKAKLMNCDYQYDELYHYAAFSTERQKRNGKPVWKIRLNEDVCVGVQKIKKNEKLNLMSCDSDDDQILWILGSGGCDSKEYEHIYSYASNSYCIRANDEKNIKLSKKCKSRDDNSIFEPKCYDELDGVGALTRETAIVVSTV